MADEPVENEYPKMVYPGRGPKDKVLSHAALNGDNGGGIVVKNKQEEDWAMEVGDLNDYEPGKSPPSKGESKPADPFAKT
jgi:hypothetical protein